MNKAQTGQFKRWQGKHNKAEANAKRFQRYKGGAHGITCGKWRRVKARWGKRKIVIIREATA